MTLHLFPIETKRLLLRPFQRADLAGVAEYLSLPDVQRYLDWRARDKAEVKTALESMVGNITLQRPGDTLILAVVRLADNALLGHVALRWADATAGQGELRFALNPLYRGQGYATEAARAMIDLAFDHFSIHRIFARCDARGSHSVKMLQGLGMRLEAHYREHALFQGEWDEELHFAILDREWRRSGSVHELRHNVA